MGLRGGHFAVRSGLYLDHGPVTLRLKGVRFCADVAVSGTVKWFRTSGRVRAQIAYATARARLTWSLARLAGRTRGQSRCGRRAPRARGWRSSRLSALRLTRCDRAHAGAPPSMPPGGGSRGARRLPSAA